MNPAVNFDDDIPVLTDVLRTRTGRMHRPDPRLAASPPEAEPDAVELMPLDLVIGHDARTEIEPYTTTEFGAHDDGESDPRPAMIGPLEADHATIAMRSEYETGVGDADYFAHAASNEAERGALLAFESADGVVGRATMRPINESVSVEAGSSIDVPEATEGDQALVDASLAPEIDPKAEADALANRVHDAVLQDLAGRIDTELDARIAQALRFELEVALASLQGGLREQLASGLRDVVHRAVKDEISRLHSEGPR